MKRRKHVTHRKVVKTKARACDGKVPYPTRERAESRRQQYIDRGAAPGALNVYACPHGAHFHVGHVAGAGGRRAS